MYKEQRYSGAHENIQPSSQPPPGNIPNLAKMTWPSSLIVLSTFLLAIPAFAHSNLPGENCTQGANIPVESCAICLEDLVLADGADIKTLPCGHKFHASCFERCVSGRTANRKLCPMCRHRIEAPRDNNPSDEALIDEDYTQVEDDSWARSIFDWIVAGLRRFDISALAMRLSEVIDLELEERDDGVVLHFRFR